MKAINVRIEKDDSINISRSVFDKIVQEVIVENKSLFVDKSYLKLKNDKSILVAIDNYNVDVKLDVNVQYGKNIEKLVEKLQKDIKQMIEHITGYSVDKIDVNIVGIEA